MTPKVSICIPAYRQTQYLKATLDSILQQNYGDYEVVIADDSRDSSVENLVREYDFGSRLTYARNPAQLGSPANWNQAVKLSRGRYIKVLHHDDWFAGSSSLAEYVEMLDSNPGAGFAFSGATARIAATGKSWHHYASESQIARLRVEPTCLFRGNFIGPPSSTMICRGSFVEYGENLVWLVDIDQYIRILQTTGFVATQKPLIVSTTQAAHQVTNLCAGNEKLNMYEYFFLFDAIKQQIPAHLRHAYIGHLIELIYASKARSVEDIRESGYGGDIPVEILSALQNSALARAWGSLRFKLSRRLGTFEQPGR